MTRTNNERRSSSRGNRGGYGRGKYYKGRGLAPVARAGFGSDATPVAVKMQQYELDLFGVRSGARGWGSGDRGNAASPYPFLSLVGNGMSGRDYASMFQMRLFLDAAQVFRAWLSSCLLHQLEFLSVWGPIAAIERELLRHARLPSRSEYLRGLYTGNWDDVSALVYTVGGGSLLNHLVVLAANVEIAREMIGKRICQASMMDGVIQQIVKDGGQKLSAGFYVFIPVLSSPVVFEHLCVLWWSCGLGRRAVPDPRSVRNTLVPYFLVYEKPSGDGEGMWQVFPLADREVVCLGFLAEVVFSVGAETETEIEKGGEAVWGAVVEAEAEAVAVMGSTEESVADGELDATMADAMGPSLWDSGSSGEVSFVSVTEGVEKIAEQGPPEAGGRSWSAVVRDGVVDRV